MDSHEFIYLSPQHKAQKTLECPRKKEPLLLGLIRKRGRNAGIWTLISCFDLFFSSSFSLFLFLLFIEDLVHARLALYMYPRMTLNFLLSCLHFPTLPCLIYAVLEIKPRDLCMLEKHSTDWDTFLFLKLVLHCRVLSSSRVGIVALSARGGSESTLPSMVHTHSHMVKLLSDFSTPSNISSKCSSFVTVTL